MAYQDTLAAVADNPQTWAQNDRAAIFDACQEAWFETGEIHIATVRRYITRNVAPNSIGANIHAFVKKHDMKVTGYAPNGDTKSGNKNKPAPIWRKA